jgi:hypothetical protein
MILRDASPEVREGSAQAGALLREEPVALPLTPIAQFVRTALDEAARDLATPSETATYASARSNMSDGGSRSAASQHTPTLQRSPSQSSDEDAAFFRSMENEIGRHIPTTSNADELNASDFDRLMSESPRHSDAGGGVHHDWQIVPQGHQEPREQTGLSEQREMVPAFAPEHRPAYHVELPTDSDAGSSHHVSEGALGRHDPNMPRIEDVTSQRDHIVIDIPSDSSSSRTSSVASTSRAGGATGAGGAGRIGETSEIPGAAPPSRIAQAVGAVRSLLEQVMGNNFTHPLPGWGANIAHAAMRDGATVFVATALREVVGYLVQQATTRGTAHAQAQGPSHLAASEHAQVLASAGIIAGVAGLNLMSLAYNARSGRQTARSVPSQAFNLAALGAASAAAYGTGTLGAVMPLLAKAVAYTGLRDGMNLFTNLRNNREELAPHASQSNMAANWSEMLVYSANQFVVSTLQGRPPAHSGTSSWAQEHSLHHVIPNLLAFAAANAGGEIADSTVYPALEAYHDAGGGRAGLHASGNVRLRASLRTPMSTAASQNIPTHEAIAQHLLGPFTARTTMFATLYATAGALSRLHPTHHINENGVTQVTTAILSALTGLLVVPFITSLDTQAPPQREERERDLEMGEHPPA